MSISTSTQLILLFMFALVLNVWALNVLLVAMIGTLLLLAYFKNKHFFRLMKRMKWFYFVMFAIFVFNTPGQHIAHWSFAYKPTYEGVEAGLTQVLRISIILGMLSIILVNNTKQQLISGLYFLIKPMSCLGLDTQRFSARLWLTLYYVELRQENNQDLPKPHDLLESLEGAFSETESENIVIELEKPVFTWQDITVLLIMLILLTVAFLSLEL